MCKVGSELKGVSMSCVCMYHATAWTVRCVLVQCVCYLMFCMPTSVPRVCIRLRIQHLVFQSVGQ